MTTLASAEADEATRLAQITRFNRSTARQRLADAGGATTNVEARVVTARRHRGNHSSRGVLPNVKGSPRPALATWSSSRSHLQKRKHPAHRGTHFIQVDVRVVVLHLRGHVARHRTAHNRVNVGVRIKSVNVYRRACTVKRRAIPAWSRRVRASQCFVRLPRQGSRPRH